MGTTFIYALCEPGTRTVRYIGKSNDPAKRLRQHPKKSGSIKLKNHLAGWLRKVGIPELIVLREVPSNQWQTAEERYIRLARGCGMNLVNSTDGGEGIHNPSFETRAKLSAACSGAKHPMFGKSLPPETRAKMSAAKIGKSRPPEVCAKMSASKMGKLPSLEARVSMRAAQQLRRTREKEQSHE